MNACWYCEEPATIKVGADWLCVPCDEANPADEAEPLQWEWEGF